jgi:hypothetical protein
MSHFTRIRTKIVEKQFLTQALQDLGYAYQEGDLMIRGYAGNRTPVEIKIPAGSYDIGFHRQGDAYELVADWWGIRDIDERQFVERLTQRYSYHAARTKLEEQGFTLINEGVEQDGRVHLTLRRVV